jgi:hypothetical protein
VEVWLLFTLADAQGSRGSNRSEVAPNYKDAGKAEYAFVQDAKSTVHDWLGSQAPANSVQHCRASLELNGDRADCVKMAEEIQTVTCQQLQRRSPSERFLSSTLEFNYEC